MAAPTYETMNIVIAGHVDHGKSTIIGRLLADTNSLPNGKLEQVKELCRRTSKPFEYAFLLDALKDERSQGITIDMARCFFKTSKRHYIIIDAPGHIEFLKNMVTGASRAEAALLVIDAKEGIRENSRRHGYLLAMLGITQIVVLVNKMDLVGYNKKTFQSIEKEYRNFLKKIGLTPTTFIPVSGMAGAGITRITDALHWYTGQTVLDALDAFTAEKSRVAQPFRMPVQDVYKFTQDGDDRRMVVGSIESGALTVGDTVIFYPSGKKSTVKTIETFNAKKTPRHEAGRATAFTLMEQIYVKRGELAALAHEQRPHVTSRIKVTLFWLGRNALQKKKTYLLKVGSAKVEVTLTEIISIINASTLKNTKKETVERHDVAECILTTDKAIAFDIVADLATTSRFVLIDNYEIAGGGIIREGLADDQSWAREKVIQRNYKWESSSIAAEDRAKKYNQRSALLLITGAKDSGKKTLARALEKKLFSDGRLVYFLGIGNVLYGVDADLKKSKEREINRAEHLRRLGEVSNLLLDAGILLIVTAIELTHDDLEIIKTSVPADHIETIWLGENITTDIVCDMHVPTLDDPAKTAGIIEKSLQDRGIIFNPS